MSGQRSQRNSGDISRLSRTHDHNVDLTDNTEQYFLNVHLHPKGRVVGPSEWHFSVKFSLMDALNCALGCYVFIMRNVL